MQLLEGRRRVLGLSVTAWRALQHNACQQPATYSFRRAMSQYTNPRGPPRSTRVVVRDRSGKTFNSHPWTQPQQLGPCHKNMVKALSNHLQRFNLPGVWGSIRILTENGVLARVPPELLQGAFNGFYAHESPWLGEYLCGLYRQHATFACFQTYARGVQLLAEEGRPNVMADAYLEARRMASKPSPVEELLVMGQLLYDHTEALSGPTRERLFVDFLTLPPTLREPLLELLLPHFISLKLPRLGWLIQQAIDAGYTPSLETKATLLDGLVGTAGRTSLALRLYADLCAADRIPSAHIRLSLLQRVLAMEQTPAPSNEAVQVLLKIPPWTLINEILTAGEKPDTAVIGRLLESLGKAGQRDSITTLYRLLSIHSLQDNAIKSGYLMALFHSGDVKEAEALLQAIITDTFIRQSDGRFSGPNSERLLAVSRRMPSWRADVNDLARLFAPLLQPAQDVPQETTTQPTPRQKIVTRLTATIMDRPTITTEPIITAACCLLRAYRQQHAHYKTRHLLDTLMTYGCIDTQLLDYAFWLAQDTQDWSRIQALSQTMQLCNIPTSLAMRQVLIAPLVAADQLAEAKRHIPHLLRQYQECPARDRHLYQDPEVLVRMLATIYAERSNVSAVKELLELCRIHDYPLCTDTTDCLLTACLHRQSLEQLNDAIKYVQRLSGPLRASSYAIIVRFYSRRKSVRQAEAWYDRARKHGLRDDRALDAAIFQCYAHYGNPPYAVAFYERMRQQPDFCMDHDIFTALLTLTGRRNAHDELVLLWQTTTRNIMRPNTDNLIALSIAACRTGNYALAVSALLDLFPTTRQRPPLPPLERLHRALIDQPAHHALLERVQQAFCQHYDMQPTDPDYEERKQIFLQSQPIMMPN